MNSPRPSFWITAVHASATASFTSSISSIEKRRRLATVAAARRPRATHSGRAGMRSSTRSGTALLDDLVHTRAFIAASSLSKMPKILTRPVMSKIFLICGLVQTKFTEPPCSRTRLRPPIKTPKAGRIDVADFLQVDDEVVDSAIDQRPNRILHFRRSIYIDFTAKLDDVAVSGCLTDVHLDVQAFTPRLCVVARRRFGTRRPFLRKLRRPG